MRVEDFLTNSARAWPSKPAIISSSRTLTYSQFLGEVERVAAALRALGLQRDDRVVLFADNRIEVAIGIFATLRAGAVFSVINPSTKADKLAYVLGNCEAAVLITQQSLAEVAAQAVRQSPSVRTTVVIEAPASASLSSGVVRWDDLLAPRAALPPEPQGIDIDLAMLVYTSGSTGEPKGVMMTHRNIDHASQSITSYLENTADDVILTVLPLAFDYGLYQLLMAVRVGATLVLEQSFAFPQQILQLIPKHRVTGFPLVPTMAALLLQMRSLDPAMFATVRYVSNTAAALPPAHIERLRSLFSHGRVFSMYGLTECKRCTWLPPAELDRRPTSVGRPIPNTEGWIVDPAGKKLPAGEVGELVIRGGHVMKGYWRNQEATDRALKPGPLPLEMVLYTGDLFRMDEEGFLYFVGRKDDIIKSRGEKVSPKEVENVLYSLEGIREAAVVGVPDPILGNALKAIVALGEGAQLTERDILAHCAARLEDFMVPRRVEFRESLPKGDTGKIQRALLQREANGS